MRYFKIIGFSTLLTLISLLSLSQTILAECNCYDPDPANTGTQCAVSNVPGNNTCSNSDQNCTCPGTDADPNPGGCFNSIQAGICDVASEGGTYRCAADCTVIANNCNDFNAYQPGTCSGSMCGSGTAYQCERRPAPIPSIAPTQPPNLNQYDCCSKPDQCDESDGIFKECRGYSNIRCNDGISQPKFCVPITPTSKPTPLPEPTLYPCGASNFADCKAGCYWDTNTNNCKPTNSNLLGCNTVCGAPDVGSDPNIPDDWNITGPLEGVCGECGVCRYTQGYYRCVTPQGATDPSQHGEDVLPTPVPYNPCQGLANPDQCEACYFDEIGTWTALGCLPSQPAEFTKSLISIIFSITGGLAIILLIYASFLCLTSQGNPERSQSCRETITAVVAGIIFLVFSLFLIRLIFGPAGILPGYIPYL